MIQPRSALVFLLLAPVLCFAQKNNGNFSAPPAQKSVAARNNPNFGLVQLYSGTGHNAHGIVMSCSCSHTCASCSGLNLNIFAAGHFLFSNDSRSACSCSLADPGVNTVIIDRKSNRPDQAKTTLRVDGRVIHAVRVSAPATASKQFERTAVMVDIDSNSFYVLDVFRVIGGREHLKFLSGLSSTPSTTGLAPRPSNDFNSLKLMQNFKLDTLPSPGWTADWKISGSSGSAFNLRVTDLTTDAQAGTCQAPAVSPSCSDSAVHASTSLVFTRRLAADSNKPLASTFIQIFEPYTKSPLIRKVSRTSVEPECGGTYPDAVVGLEIEFVDGSKDFLMVTDIENPLGLQPSYSRDLFMMSPFWFLRSDAELIFVRRNPNGDVTNVAFANGRTLEIDAIVIELENKTPLFEKVYP